jgi:hypothetical protein
MDMKKILAAVNGKAATPKASASDMKKFMSIVTESATNRLSVAEQMAVQQYTPEPKKNITSPVLNVAKDAKPSMIGKYFKKVEEEIAEAAERNNDRARQLAERVINRINEKTGDVDSAVKDYMSKGGKIEKLPTKKPRKSEKTDFGSKHIGGRGEVSTGKATRIGKSAKTDPKGKPVVTAEGIFSDSEEDLAKRSPQLQQLLAMRPKYKGTPQEAELEKRIKLQKDRISLDQGEVMGKDGKPVPVLPPGQMRESIAELKKLRDSLNEQISVLEEYYTAPPNDSKSPIPGDHVKGCRCKEVEEGLRDPKDNPCWKGYKPVGTKKKGGRTVPNCVPKESVQKTGPAGQLKAKGKVDVKGTVLGSPEKSQKGLRNKLVGDGA